MKEMCWEANKNQTAGAAWEGMSRSNVPPQTSGQRSGGGGGGGGIVGWWQAGVCALARALNHVCSKGAWQVQYNARRVEVGRTAGNVRAPPAWNGNHTAKAGVARKQVGVVRGRGVVARTKPKQQKNVCHACRRQQN